MYVEAHRKRSYGSSVPSPLVAAARAGASAGPRLDLTASLPRVARAPDTEEGSCP